LRNHSKRLAGAREKPDPNGLHCNIIIADCYADGMALFESPFREPMKKENIRPIMETNFVEVYKVNLAELKISRTIGKKSSLYISRDAS
jgi:hypothetical protein